MKITKNGKTVKSSVERPVHKKIAANTDKQEAVEYIRSAISVLGNSAIKGDAQSKDAIANLSVILFDLK